MKYVTILLVLLLCSCKQITGGVDPFSVIPDSSFEEEKEEEIKLEKEMEIPIATHFDFPVGKPDAKGYYNALKYRENDHLGNDWNAVTGGNTDIGDPIYAIANGKVTYAQDHGSGWGNVIRITHRLPNSSFVESLYAHCDEILVSTDSILKRGDQIGTIGTANGAYLAHLHFEMRDDLELPVGGGYSADASGYLNPREFIDANR